MNNLPKKSNNIFYKIKLFFIKLFKKDYEEILSIEAPKIQTNNEFRENLEKQVKLQNNKNDIIDKIDKTPELILTLPPERLKQLSELYDEQLLEVELKIRKLKSQINSI